MSELSDGVVTRMKITIYTILILGSTWSSGKAASPTAWWRFDNPVEQGVHESISGHVSDINGKAEWVTGVKGRALLFDGFTTHMNFPGEQMGAITGPFTVEAWVALGSYPWNWCPLVDQMVKPTHGYFFGINAEGRLGLFVSAAAWVQGIKSEAVLPLRQWVHVAGTFDPQEGLTVYINGQRAAHGKIEGRFTPRQDAQLFFGKSRRKKPADYRHKLHFEENGFDTYSYVSIYLDGILDELKEYTDPSLESISINVGIEKVHYVKGQGGVSSFSFGEGYGMLQGITAAFYYPITLITPQEWKKEMMGGMGKEKDASVYRASQIFPNIAGRLVTERGRK